MRNLRKPDSAAKAVQKQIEERKADLTGKECTQARRDDIVELYVCMAKEVTDRVCRMTQAQCDGDSKRLWDLIAACAEGAFVKFLGLEGPDATRMRGRSKVDFQN